MKVEWTYWLTMVTFVIALSLTVWFLFGNSPTFDQFVVGWVSFLSMWLFHTNYHFDKRITNLEQRLHDKLTELERRIFDKIDSLKSKA